MIVLCGMELPLLAQGIKQSGSNDEAVGDSIKQTPETSDRNVMLNASNANKPRDIQIGLPATAGGTDIFEDGLPTGYYFWPLLPYMHWRSGVSYEQMGMKNLSEASLTSGNVGYAVDSHTWLGNDTFKGFVDYTTNQFGMHKLDMNVSGRITKGWYYTGSVFQNFDPGSTDFKFMDNQDRTQIYKAGITRRWNENRGQLSFLYKYTKSRMLAEDIYGPFFYVGDGSVKEMEGFSLGHDAYMPADGKMTYMDIETGELVHTNFADKSTSYTSEYFVLSKYDWDNGLKLTANMKYSHSNSAYIRNFLSGLENVSADKGYTYTDGEAFAGNVQSRYMMYYRGRTDDLLATAELTRLQGTHNWRLGLNEWNNHVTLHAMTSNFAHTVASTSEQLYFQGQEVWGLNSGGEYYKGNENKLALYFSDEWSAGKKLHLYYGLRLEYYHIDGNSPMNASNTDTNNNRTDNFSLRKDGVTLAGFNHDWINPIVTAKVSYNLFGGFGLTSEYLFNRQRPRLENFAGSDIPSLSPVDVNLGIFGIYYNNSWVSLVSNLTYITKSNYKSRIQFTKTVDGVSETQTKAVMYNIGTLGWTTDMVLTPFKGFSLHLLATFQKPEYKDFVTNLTFSDGSGQTYDYSGKVVTNISQMLFEIDPSYIYKDWRFWTSFRYFGKQYANKTNSIYFNGRWETFAGVDYKVNKNLSLSVNFVNLLNQKGAQGEITAADLLEDTSMFKEYLMSGSYIRTFTVEFSAKIAF